MTKMKSATPLETKTITIRGVNKSIYEQFIAFVPIAGKSTGELFTRIIAHYRKERPMHLKRHIKNKSDVRIEVVRDLDKLVLSSDDFESAGENVKFVFRNIKKLIFDESVSNKLLLKYVLRISKSNVQGKLARLFLLSTIDNKINVATTDEKKDITIRNVGNEAYDEFISACQLENKTIAAVTDEVLSRAVIHFEISMILLNELQTEPLQILTIKGLDYIEVSNQDLEELEDRKVFFHRIEKLVFTNDVQYQTFSNTVAGIYNCGEVVFSKNIPKLIRLSRNQSFPN